MRSANLFFFTQPQEMFEEWYQAQIQKDYYNQNEEFFAEFQQIPINYGTITGTAYQDSLYWKEQHLYGSSRLGIAKPELEVTNHTPSNASTLTTNFKNYELTNHLGNILATIKDEKQQIDQNADGIVDYYEPIVITANDYYPFGMVMPNRSFSLAGSGYRFGFNTQEKDDEVYGKGNLMSADYWEYDTRIGRRWNTDPIVKVWESPYLVNSGNPIALTDPNGDDGKETKDNNGKSEWTGDVVDECGGKANGTYSAQDMQDYGYKPDRTAVVINEKRTPTKDQKINTKENSSMDQMGLNLKDRFFGQLQSMNQLRNFANGLGGNEVYFSSTSSYSGMMRGSPGVRKAIEQYANGGEKNRGYIFTPDSDNKKIPMFNQIQESVEAHLDFATFMNLPRLTIGGYTATIVPIKGSDIYVRVHLYNEMSMGSLMGHLEYFKNNPPTAGNPFSTVKMHFDLGIFDLSTFKK